MTDTEDARVQPAGDSTFWTQVLQDQPEVLHRLLGDLWRVAQQARPASPSTAAPASPEEIFELILPRYSSAPFPQALTEALGDRSVRWLARQLNVHHSHVNRWITGQRPIVNAHDPEGGLAQIEAIAEALGIHPAYFAQWRRLWVLLLLDEAFERHPNLSIGVWRKFSSALTPPNGRA